MNSERSAPTATWPSVVPSASAPDSSSCGLLLEQGERLREQVVDLALGQVQRAVDQVLPELVDRLDGAGLNGRPLTGDLPHHEPDQPADDRERADDRDE